MVLFHALDDASRRSSLEALRRSGRLASVQALRPFTRHGRTLFLPDGPLPSASALDAVLRLCETAPELFDLRPGDLGAPDHGLQFALFRVPSDRSGGVEETILVPLVNAVFRNHSSLWPENSRVEVSVAAVSRDSDGLGRLADALAEAGGRNGHRLELHRISTRQTSDGEIDTLLKRLTDLQQRYAALAGERMARPRLLRFAHSRLDRLAGLLRRLPTPEGVANGVRYGIDPRGGVDPQHYLLIDTARTPLPTPNALWGEESDDAVEFIANPFWMHHYGRYGRSPSVFVPARHALYPVLHGWSRTEAEAHLRGIIGGWLTERTDGATVPAHPLYVFEPAQREGGRLRLRILDADAFQPLDRSVLHWIADNIELDAAAVVGIVDRYAVVAAAAERAAALRLAEELTGRSAAAEERLHALAASTHEEVASQGEELLMAVAAEVERIATAAEVAIGELDTFRKRLVAIERAQGVAANLVQRLDRHQAETERAAAAAVTAETDLGKGLNERLVEIEAATMRVDAQVQAQLGRLSTAINALRDRIAESWSW